MSGQVRTGQVRSDKIMPCPDPVYIFYIYNIIVIILEHQEILSLYSGDAAQSKVSETEHFSPGFTENLTESRRGGSRISCCMCRRVKL